ncbi:hypothetical protein REH65_19675 [Saccharopolyspora sp. ID03-671]|uniref:hypothetical protein n=1 Tax=Saccharopolyspora sp. ID03-671 TaxID=3073066 RepID=UPI00324963BB
MSQQGPTTALEQAIERYANDPEAIDQVYREFLIAKLFLVTSEDSADPVMVSVEGQEKQQVWVCTNKKAVPDFAPGTTVVNGYQLLPMLPELNVHVATGPDAQDVMLIGSRAILQSAPEITDELRAAAQQRLVPGSLCRTACTRGSRATRFPSTRSSVSTGLTMPAP